MDDLESFEEPALDEEEARLNDVRLADSKGSGGWVGAAWDSRAVGQSCARAGKIGLPRDGEANKVGSDGKGFLYLSFGMRAGGEWPVKSTPGAMANGKQNDEDLGRMHCCGLARGVESRQLSV